MTRLASVLLLFTIGRLPSAGLLAAATPEPVTIAALPKLHGGVPAYPVPFMAVARTPHTIAPLAGRAIDIQTDFGYPAGFSGLVDAAIGSIGYPGYRNFSNLDIAYDADKLCLLVCVPYPSAEARARATEPSRGLARGPPQTTCSRCSSIRATSRAARRARCIASSATPAACAGSIATCRKSASRTRRGRRGCGTAA